VTIAIIVAVFLVVDTLVVGVLIGYFVRNTWQTIATRWPARPIAEDAVRRPFQSFSIGIVNLGWSIHVAVDEAYLHLDPARFWRWFGATRASVPWGAMELIGRIRGKWATVRIGAQRIDGPAWCLGLVDPAAREAAGGDG